MPKDMTSIQPIILASTNTAKTTTASLPSSKPQQHTLLLFQDIVHSQKYTLHLFLSNGPTRTPAIVMYVASFGGALHAAVTTYYYLAIGASETDIGTLGFIMSAGALLGAPFTGMTLDNWGPWVPISITAGACSVGCLWRGLASNITSLMVGAILLGVGVNMWTVILGHLVKSFPPSKRSEIISGFGVQIAVLQLAGKGMFPFTEYALHHIFGVEDVLLRYRIHMGMCTFFCFFGTFALFWDKKNVVGGIRSITAGVKYQQKHSDSFGDVEEGDVSTTAMTKEMEMVDITKYSDSIPSPFSDDQSNSSSSSTFLNDLDPSDNGEQEKFVTVIGNEISPKKHHLFTTITLTAALLLQAIGTTVFIVLWPLIVHDRFNVSAHTFGILTFIASVVSMVSVASFPILERIDSIGGRLRCVAWGFGVCSFLSVLFCFCSFGDFWFGDSGNGLKETEVDLISTVAQFNSSQSLLRQYAPMQQLHFRKQFGLHAFAAVVLQAALCFLEPSLKTNLSLLVNSPTVSAPSKGSSLGGTMGFLQSLGSIGGMVGNLVGTMLYKKWCPLPFFVISFFMAIFSALIWMLEEPSTISEIHEGSAEKEVNLEPIEVHKEVKPDRSCLALRETTYDLKLD